jgi:MtN3 and saliva related transmembrane protein
VPDSPTAFLEAAASLAGVVMALIPLAQLRLILRLRDASQVSFALFACIAVGVCLWAAYGLAISDPWLWAPNVASALANGSVCAAVLRYRSATPRPA